MSDKLKFEGCDELNELLRWSCICGEHMLRRICRGMDCPKCNRYWSTQELADAINAAVRGEEE